MTAYYNEFDPQAAAWLRELIANGHIAPGDVDERSIVDVKPHELAGYTQCHFFAGIGGWSYALRLAGVPDDFPVWTGSCPCQPFSTAGAGLGYDDERNLWWSFYHLISQCCPSTIFGEQVASKDGLHWWFDLVQPDLEAAGYITAAADLCAAGVGAPHIRQRLYFTGRLGNTDGEGSQRHRGFGQVHGAQGREVTSRYRSEVGTLGGMADMSGNAHCTTGETDSPWGNPDWLFCRDDKWRPVESGTFPLADGFPERVGLLRGYGNAIVPQVAQIFIEAVIK